MAIFSMDKQNDIIMNDTEWIVNVFGIYFDMYEFIGEVTL